MLVPTVRAILIATISLIGALALVSCATTSSRYVPPAREEPGWVSLGENKDPNCPPPQLPRQAMLFGQQANLELAITADRDGTVRKVTISKPSRTKLYDEYTRLWVEKSWKMPAAREGEPDVRTFIAPIVYPKPQVWEEGGYFPPPQYPGSYISAGMEGIVILKLGVGRDGNVEAADILQSSGHKPLDKHVAWWVQNKWKFPPGEPRLYEYPVVFMIKR